MVVFQGGYLRQTLKYLFLHEYQIDELIGNKNDLPHVWDHKLSQLDMRQL